MSDTPQEFADAWDAVIADMDATATEYREEGWDALELHPGDVTVLTGAEYRGFDVVVPDGEFESIEGFVADAAFDTFEVFRAESTGRVFALVAAMATAAERVVLFPVFFERGGEDVGDLRAHAESEGEIEARVRPLAKGPSVTFTCEKPSLFFPDATGTTDA